MGFIGSHAVRVLKARGCQVIVLRSRSYQGEDCDVAVHFYALSAADSVHFVAQFAARAQRLIVISSGDVYQAYGRLNRTEPGPVENAPLTEDAPLRTRLFPYPTHPDYDKIPVERTAMAAGPANCVLRLPAVYGPGDSHHRLAALRKQAQQPIGPQYANWRWTHGYVEDMAHAIALAVTNPRSAGRIFNLGEATTPTMAERFQQWGWAVVPGGGDPGAPLDYRHNLVMDSSRIRNELGYSEIVPPAEAFARTVMDGVTNIHIEA